MHYWLAANVVLVIHLLFVIYVVCGGILAFKWKYSIIFHLPAVLWGALLEFNGWLCPLTPLEQWLRVAGGQQGYSGGFVEHYLLFILYPTGLTREIQILLGVFAVLVNILIYTALVYRSLRKRG